MKSARAGVRLRMELHRSPDEAMPNRKLTKSALLDRPSTRRVSGTTATNMTGRTKAKRVRARKAQRQARKSQP